MKRYVIFAGVNGAGKTTLYQTSEEYRDIPRVNVDEIVREIGNWKDPQTVAKAGRIAVKRIKEYMDSGQSFNQETTLCGRSIFSLIKRAKELGYAVDLFYVGLQSEELAIERVNQRVKAGGHGIPEEDIRRRYRESLNNLQKVITLCDSVRIYDNTEEFKRIGSYAHGECIDMVDNLPEWSAFLNE